MPDESSESKEHCFIVRVCVQMRGMEPHPQQNNLGIPGPPVPGVPLDRRPKLIEGTVYHIFSCDAEVCMGCCWCHGVLGMASLLKPCSGAVGAFLSHAQGRGEQFNAVLGAE